jgi:tRNA pseudouridine38-40 synthase
MAQVFERKINIHGCGRTDAGVHASQYFFHADLPAGNEDKLIFILNKNVPDDIRFLSYLDVEAKFNAQLDAFRRTYSYFLHQQADPFLSERSTFVEKLPESKPIMEVLPLLKGRHDFKAFTLTPERQGDTHCHIYRADIEISPDGNKIKFIFEADRFVRGMVRLLVGNLLELGKGKMTGKAFLAHLESGERPKFNRLAYPQGLYLSKVSYPDFEMEALPSLPF